MRCVTSVGLIALITLAGCAGLSKYQLKNDYYEFHQPGKPSAKVFVKSTKTPLKLLHWMNQLK